MNVLLIAALTAFVTQYLGWIAVPVIALIAAAQGARKLGVHAWQVGAGAALAWAVLLFDATRSSAFSPLLHSLAGVFQIPGFALIFAALLLPFALGWSTTVVASAFLPRSET